MKAMIPEIMDHIFGLLHADGDFPTLDRASKIFPQFVNRHLYSKIALALPIHGLPLSKCPFNNKPTYTMDPTTFAILLAIYRNIAAHVRILRIILHVGHGPFAALTQLPRILASLPQLNSIQLWAPDNAPVPWQELLPEFCTSFQTKIRSPSVHSVAVSSIKGFFLSTFDLCRNLKHLRLDTELGYDLTSSTCLSPPQCCPSLHSLRIVIPPGWPDSKRLTSWMKENKAMQTLSIHLYFSGFIPKSYPLIAVCSATLVNLELGFFHNDQLSADHIFPANRFPSLQHLTLRSRLNMITAKEYYSSLPSLTSFLHSITPSSVTLPIRLTLHLSFQFCMFKVQLRSKADPENSHESDAPVALDWSTVIAILVLPNLFHHPIKVYFAEEGSANRHGTFLVDAVSSFERNLDVRTLVEEGKVIVGTG